MRKHLIELSKILESLGSTFVLGDQDDEAALPHLSLYQLRIARSQREELSQLLTEISSRTKAFRANLINFSVFANAYVFCNVTLGKPLNDLHQSVVQGLNPVRRSRLLDVHQQLLDGTSLQPVERQMIEEWGNPTVMANFKPHFTIAHLDRPEDLDTAIALVEKERPRGMTFKISGIWTADIGPHGTCPGSAFRLL